MQIHRSSDALQLSPMGRAGGKHCKMHTISSKDLPKSQSLFASYLKEIKEFLLDLCQVMQVCSWEMQIIFLNIRALPTTNDLWSNQESPDPQSHRCVWIG